MILNLRIVVLAADKSTRFFKNGIEIAFIF